MYNDEDNDGRFPDDSRIEPDGVQPDVFAADLRPGYLNRLGDAVAPFRSRQMLGRLRSGVRFQLVPLSAVGVPTHALILHGLSTLWRTKCRNLSQGQMLPCRMRNARTELSHTEPKQVELPNPAQWSSGEGSRAFALSHY
jgi:hypothetical protein